MKITYISSLGMYRLEMKGFDFRPHYGTRLDAIASGLRLIAYYNNL